MEHGTETEEETTRVRVSVWRDDNAESPGNWDEPFTLYSLSEKKDRGYGAPGDIITLYSLSEKKDRGYGAPENIREVAECKECKEWMDEHPIDYEEDEGRVVCESFVLADNITLAVMDSCGPYTVLRIEKDIEEWNAIASRYHRDLSACYFLPAAYDSNQEWLASLTVEGRKEVLTSVLHTWNQYLSGDVYGVTVEATEDCGHFETRDSIGGLYGYEYARDPKTWIEYGLITEEESRGDYEVKEEY